MKAIGTKDIKRGKKKGLKPNKRALAKPSDKKLQANQWQSTPQQNQFMEYWLDVNSVTFGNAHKSALRAGYSKHYALQLSAPSVNNKWLTEYHKRINFTEEHIRQGITNLAMSSSNSKSPDDTRLRAYELLARINGLIDNKQITNNVVVQPILGSKSTQAIEVKE